jgi:7,8-dihydro-6-hydroxymethylpterin-pyrophosphokinase
MIAFLIEIREIVEKRFLRNAMKNIDRLCSVRTRIFLGLGTNMGNREENLREASEHIKNLGLDIVRLSSIYETEPVGYANQAWFLNQVAEVGFTPALNLHLNKDAQTVIENCLEKDFEFGWKILAGELLHALLSIEELMGRQRVIVNGPRVIDIDLLLYGDLLISAVVPFNRLQGEADYKNFMNIPHPRLHLRRFVLEPLCEIAPEFIHPVFKKSLTELLTELVDDSTVRFYHK